MTELEKLERVAQKIVVQGKLLRTWTRFYEFALLGFVCGAAACIETFAMGGGRDH